MKKILTEVVYLFLCLFLEFLRFQHLQSFTISCFPWRFNIWNCLELFFWQIFYLIILLLIICHNILTITWLRIVSCERWRRFILLLLILMLLLLFKIYHCLTRLHLIYEGITAISNSVLAIRCWGRVLFKSHNFCFYAFTMLIFLHGFPHIR